jgi:hypothetical protein
MQSRKEIGDKNLEAKRQKSHNGKKKGKLQPTTIAPSIHIPSHIMEQTTISLTRKSRKGSNRMKNQKEIS